MTNTRIETVTLERGADTEVPVLVTVQVTEHTDMDYGADADGNRGEIRTFVDEVELIKVEDMQGEDITNLFSKDGQDKLAEEAAENL